MYIGVGKSDSTGPIGEINMLGYASLTQSANGIHLRLNARAFIFASSIQKRQRVVYVSLDTGFTSNRSREMALTILRKMLGEEDASLYTLENLLVSATHTHSGPGGTPDDFMYQITSLGVVEGEREAIALGIAQAVYRAHLDLEKNGAGTDWKVVRGELEGAGVNRSKKAYLNNPEAERAGYGKDVDTGMDLVAVRDQESKRLRGVVSWFAVHGVSMNNTNELVSGDNKGFASYLFELEQARGGDKGFVAAFGQSNAGDVSPNIDGPRCENTGEVCDGSKDSCGGKPRLCVAHGPGFYQGLTDAYSTEVIGRRQFLKAKALASEQETTADSLVSTGPVLFAHAYVHMPSVPITLPDGTQTTPCTPAMGYAFSAGTTDGVATPISWQGDNSTTGTNKLLNIVRDFLAKPSPTLQDCHAPKPILLNTGETKFPYDWQPSTVPLQLFTIGRKFAILAQPSEITTMAGRRLRDSTLTTLVHQNILDPDARIVLAAYANTYTSYVTTREEYQIQRYEGASTIYGPHTLLAYQTLFTQLAQSLADPTKKPLEAPPVTQRKEEWSLLPDVVLDTPHPAGKKFGDCISTRFRWTPEGPLNGDEAETFLVVEKNNSLKGWEVFLTDAEWDTKFEWRRVGVAGSECVVSWDVGRTFEVQRDGGGGEYRLKVFGRAKGLGGVVRGYEGVSEVFVV
ncbi:hypothetical protein HDV05_008804 [Chytridiales sp. JEL 0842]|nr:hypothetical protein HDV05_008804 [Chytridiales sp. JEL 0842]